MKEVLFLSVCYLAAVVLLFANPPSKGRLISKCYQRTAVLLICVTVVTLVFGV